VVLIVSNPVDLQRAVERASISGIRMAVFYEPDDALGLTAACSEPLTGTIQRIFRRFPLWREAAIAPSARGPPTHNFEPETLQVCVKLRRLRYVFPGRKLWGWKFI
jgi:hypothetical protein